MLREGGHEQAERFLSTAGVSLRSDMVTAAREVSLLKNRAAIRAVLWADLASGALDITAAFVVYGYFGAKPVPLLQGIASTSSCARYTTPMPPSPICARIR